MKVKKFYSAKTGEEIGVCDGGLLTFACKFLGMPVDVTCEASYENLCKLADKGILKVKEVNEITIEDIHENSAKYGIPLYVTELISLAIDEYGPDNVEKLVNAFIHGTK